jgi:hypothetical protein
MLTLLRRLKRRLKLTLSPTETPPDPVAKEAKWYLTELGRAERKTAHIQFAVTKTVGLEGMVVECGVAVAGSLSLFTHMLRRSNDSRRIIAVDSFEGFPAGSVHDSPNFSPDKKSHYRLFTERFAYENLMRSGLSKFEADSVEFFKGWIPEVLLRFEGPISILHVDVDLYEPYRDSLAILWPRVQEGGVVLFDEYDQGRDEEKWPGAKKAIDEFCAQHHVPLQKHWSGFAFVVK